MTKQNRLTRCVNPLIILCIVCSFVVTSNAYSAYRPGNSANSQQGQQIDNDISILEKELIALQKNHVNIYLQMDTDDSFFDIQTLKASINTKVIAKHTYENHELAALGQGGIHRIFQGAIRQGKYELIVHLMGRDTDNQVFRRRLSHKFTKKKSKPVFIQIKITNQMKRKRPTFLIEEW